MALDPNVSLNIYQNNTTDGIKLWPMNGASKMINTNNGQFVLYGDGNVHSGKNLQLGFTNSTIQDVNTALNINSPSWEGVKVNTQTNYLKMYSINNSNFGYSPYALYGDGNMHIGKALQIGFTNSGIQNTNIAININNAGGDGIKFNTYNNGANLISVSNPNLPLASAFTIYGEGRTEINTYNTVEALSIKGYNGSTLTKNFVIYGDGRVFIGAKRVQTTNAQANAILQIAGKIACQELVVLDPVKWADFVFEKDYKLETLNKVEEHYLKNKHLKNVPSAVDVKTNGINSAEMDAILLQKVEELTLYMVDLNKQVQELKKQNAELKKAKK